MKNSLLTKLRDKNSSTVEFRRAADRLAHTLAVEVGESFEHQEIDLQTPLKKSSGVRLKHPIVLIPILRVGLALFYPFLNYFEGAEVGFLGLKRDEKNYESHLYFQRLPKITEESEVIVLDPMIATGGTASAVLEILEKMGIKQTKITFVAVIAAPEGIASFKSRFPKVRIHLVALDEKLNDQKFIVPGLGDFGDRYFGLCP